MCMCVRVCVAEGGRGGNTQSADGKISGGKANIVLIAFIADAFMYYCLPLPMASAEVRQSSRLIFQRQSPQATLSCD